MPYLRIFILLCLVSLGARFMGLGLAESFYDSDSAVQLIYLLKAQKEGVFSPFAYNLGYAGLGATYLRLPIGILGEALYGFRGWLAAQMAWSFMMWPAVLGTLTYGLALTRFHRLAALAAALWITVGNTFILKFLCNDIYAFNLCLGTALLWIAAHRRLNIKPLPLFFTGALIGLGIYQSRLFLLFIAAVVAPMLWAFQKRQGFIKHLKVGAPEFLLFFLFLYLEFFGANLGKVGTRQLILHASPNLTLAVLILCARNFKLLTKTAGIFWFEELAPRLPQRGPFLFLGGLLLGYSPELYYRLSGMGQIAALPQNSYSLPEMIQNLAQLPRVWQNMFETMPGSVLAQAALVLPLIALYTLLKAPRNAPANLNNPSLLWLLGLTLFASLRMRNYAGFNERYLIPVLPAIAYGLAQRLDAVFTLKDRRLYRELMAVLLVLGFSAQFTGQFKYLNLPKHLESRFEISQVLKALDALQLDLLVSTEYWKSNQYTLFSQLRIKAVSFPTTGLSQTEALTALKGASRYALLTVTPDVPAQPGPDYVTSAIGRVNDLRLWVAQKR